MESLREQAPDSRIEAGMNGFGRFGKYLLKYWLERDQEAEFTIGYINDIGLSCEQAREVLVNDPYLGEFFSERIISADGGNLVCRSESGNEYAVHFTSQDDKNIDWVGQPSMFFECSGANTRGQDNRKFLRGETRLVLISATSLDSDAILIYGHNHTELSEQHKIVSYGSCTVNAYVPLAKFIDRSFGVEDSSCHVIHSVPDQRIDAFQEPRRQDCTLQEVAPALLSFASENNFMVTYTLAPFSGVSMIDFRFRLREAAEEEKVVCILSEAINGGALQGLYGLAEFDQGPDRYKFTPYSAVLTKSGIKMRSDTLYIQAYLDNENSANRFYDLSQYAAQKLNSPEAKK